MFKYLGSTFIVNGQGTEETRSRIQLARSAFSRLHSYPWSRPDISLHAKGRVYLVGLVVSMLAAFGIRRIPHMRRRNFVLTVELRRQFRPSSIPLVRPRCGELIRNTFRILSPAFISLVSE